MKAKLLVMMILHLDEEQVEEWWWGANVGPLFFDPTDQTRPVTAPKKGFAHRAMRNVLCKKAQKWRGDEVYIVFRAR